MRGGPDGSGGEGLTLREAVDVSGLKPTRLRELLDLGALVGWRVPGPGGTHRRWDRAALLAWVEEHPPGKRRPAASGREQHPPESGPSPVQAPTRPDGPGRGDEGAGRANRDEVDRLRAENVSLREAGLLNGLALRTLEDAWRASDEADRNRRRAQRLLRRAVRLQQDALSQFLLPGNVAGARSPQHRSPGAPAGWDDIT